MARPFERVFVSPEPYGDGSDAWRLDMGPEAEASVPREESRRRRLRHFLTGGGVASFRRTDRAYAVAEKQTRFLVGSLVLVAVWLAIWMF